MDWLSDMIIFSINESSIAQSYSDAYMIRWIKNATHELLDTSFHTNYNKM